MPRQSDNHQGDPIKTQPAHVSRPLGNSKASLQTMWSSLENNHMTTNLVRTRGASVKTRFSKCVLILGKSRHFVKLTATSATQYKSQLANCVVILRKYLRVHEIDESKRRPKEDSVFTMCDNPEEIMTVA